MYFFLKYIVTLFYKKLRIQIVVCLLRESGPHAAPGMLKRQSRNEQTKIYYVAHNEAIQHGSERLGGGGHL